MHGPRQASFHFATRASHRSRTAALLHTRGERAAVCPKTLPIGHPSLVRGEGWVAAGRERHGHVPGRARGHGRTGHRRQAHRGGDAGHFGGFEPLNSSRVDEQGQGVRQREKVRQRDRPARGCTGSSLNALTTPMYFTRRREQRAGSAQQRALGAFVPPPPTRRGFALTVRGWEPRGAQLPRAAPLLLSDGGWGNGDRADVMGWCQGRVKAPQQTHALKPQRNP